MLLSLACWLIFVRCVLSFRQTKPVVLWRYLRSSVQGEIEPEKRQRRIRYKGSYPRKFIEKYKELNGNSSTIQRVLEKGGTPAGQHVPIMVDECMEHMSLRRLRHPCNSQQFPIILDCTLGYGGHTLRILRELELYCQLFAFDRDFDEINKTTSRIRALIDKKLQTNQTHILSSHQIFTSIHDTFGNIQAHAERLGILGKVDAVLADLGVSSMQIDDPKRGFTYKDEGPLDMRMDLSQSFTALQLLQQNNVESLARILTENSDEGFASFIAQEVYSDEGNVPATTKALAISVQKGVQRAHQSMKLLPPTKAIYDKAIARTMQALRIQVNDEFGALDQLLDTLPLILRPGGKIVILTFHSGEDRRVKKFFKEKHAEGVFSSWSRDIVRPSSEEIRRNSRSKCAKLR